MASNKNYYKKLLVQATTFLTLASGANIASANNTQVTLTDPAILSNSASWSNGPFVSGDDIVFSGVNQVILDKAGYLVNRVDTVGSMNGKITVQAHTALGSVYIYDIPYINLHRIPIEFTNNTELFLVGDNFSPGNYSEVASIAPSGSLGSGNGTVYFGTNTSDNLIITYDLGTPTLKLDKVGMIRTSSANAPVIVDSLGTTLVLSDGKKIYANELQLSPESVWGTSIAGTGINNTLILESNTILDARVTTRRYEPLSPTTKLADSGGTVLVNGGTKIFQDLGTEHDPLSRVEFNVNSAAEKAYLYRDIYSETIGVNDSALWFENNVLMNGAYMTFEDSTLQLKDNTLTLRSALEFGSEGYGYNNMIGQMSIDTTVNDTKFGRIIVDGPDTYLSFTFADKFDVNLSGLTTTLPPIEGRHYLILEATNEATLEGPDNSIVNFNKLPGGNLFVNWSYSDRFIHEYPKTQAEINQILKDLIESSGGNPTTIINVISIVNSSNTGLGNAAISAANTGNLIEFINRVEPVVVEATEASYIAAAEATRTVSERISSISSPMAFNLAAQEGVAAGSAEDPFKLGTWGTTYYSTALQRGRNEAPGYKTTTVGATVGVDSLVNDTTMIGAALSISQLKIDHRDSNSGDKTDASGYLFSVYALKELSEKWFVQGILSVGTNKIKNKERRLQGGIYEIARGSYTASNYGTEVLGGYEYMVNDSIMLTPMAGAAYNRISDSWYQEIGTTFQNFLITKKADDKLEALAGARLAMAKEWNGTSVTPEVHGMLRYDVLNHSPKMDVRIQGKEDPLIPRTGQTNRLFVNLGCGINMTKGRMEYGFTYDNYLAKKYVGHQGTLKVRLNF